MTNSIIMAIQVLPKVKDGNTVSIVDKVVKIIQHSGLKYIVSPFETTMEGPFDELMQIITDSRKVCIDARVEEALFNIRIEFKPDENVTLAHKVTRYEE